MGDASRAATTAPAAPAPGDLTAAYRAEAGHTGRAEIKFARAAGRTFIARQRIAYPFHLTRPFYRDRCTPGLLTVYLQSVSGGLYEGERVGVALHASAGAQVHLTSQGSTVVHTMVADEARHDVTIEATADSLVEYVPDPLILFPAARLANRVSVVAAEGARVIVADAFHAHDSAGGEGGARPFSRLISELRVARPDGRLVCLDRFDLDGTAWAAGTPGIATSAGGQASLVVLDPADPAALVQGLAKALEPIPNLYASASVIPGEGGAWARLLAGDGIALRAGVTAAWVAARTHLTGAAPALHRK